ncbi:unnamed protein product [Didymodactylos carnosus]|uniref:Protein kinase domain-containing protein n=1 Tax=Didymodactylos carnosus TaxID=1234261 RepID=A0A8S2EQZ2_9BILA|nr:unnamed protein product [Didymodactylos carnosus]CAF4043860.1 unnamed protein product [Didymodactylos carnosus]
MAPEICRPPPEQSSFKSDVWAYGCIILEVLSGLEPWMTRFNDDAILFRALQGKENGPVFAQVCQDQMGSPVLNELLIQCCTWSKSERPPFVDILTHLDSAGDKSAISTTRDGSKDCAEKSYKNSEEQEQIVDIPNTKFSKSDVSQGRSTGEMYMSKGTANGRTIYEGVKGGRYCLTAGGSKVYLKK